MKRSKLLRCRKIGLFTHLANLIFYFRYCQAQHLKILKENSGMTHDEIKKNLLEKWTAMTTSEKEVSNMIIFVCSVFRL